jgi:hypothetical protein
VAFSTHPHLGPRLKKEQSYTSTPLWAFVVSSRVNLMIIIIIIMQNEQRKDMLVGFAISGI